MKKSELKEAIKAEIKSVLSEEIQVGDIVTIGDGKRKYEVINVEKGFMSDIDDVEVKSMDGMPIGSSNPNVGSKTATYKATQLRLAEEDLKEGTWSSGTYNEIGRFIQDVKNLRDKYYDIVGSDDVFDGLDRAEEAAREMMINAPENRSDVTFSDIREAKSAADVDKEVKDLESKMKDKAKDFKAAEGKAKDKIKDELKDMTTKRNDLKKKVEDLKKKEEEETANKGRDQELDA
jgi:hypothetical protein